VTAATVEPPSARNVGERHPSRTAGIRLRSGTRIGIFSDPGSIGAMSLAVAAVLPSSERHRMPLKSQDYFGQLENVFFPM
jgi:hypothetical protein